MNATAAKKVYSGDASVPLANISIGMKVVMAVTGASFILFIIGHLMGNMQIFIGQEQFNAYAAFLQGLGELLWIERVLIFTFFAIHIFYGIKLYFENSGARGVSYKKFNPSQTTYTARTMIWSGLALLAFVVFHIAHFTAHVVYPEYAHLEDALGRHDAYTMVVVGFQHAWVSILYIISMGFLAFHLSHALPSLFQTIGLIHPNLRNKERVIGRLFALIIFLGYVSIPVAIMAGIVRLPKGGM
ncbi:MAG: hypothetical protein GF307_01980 [candidate division Zixibacteria bacterium]|nr:hypothetical protein [candidate division Zixibacteria bacterium]